MPPSVPAGSVRALRAVAATADQVATQAAMAMFDRGGNAVDAAIAANAAIAVTAPHLCGMGGDLFALVRTPDGEVVGARRQRATPGRVPTPRRCAPRASPRCRCATTSASVTVPGCVDGWMHLHERFGQPRPGDDPRPGDPPGGVRLPGQPAAGRLARPARRRGAAAVPRAGRAGDGSRRAGAPSRCGAHAACHRGRRS